MTKSAYYQYIKRLLNENGGYPEPGRGKLGYHPNDVLALLCGILKHDKHHRSQSWRLLEEWSGIPPTTAKRILVDSRHDSNSPLHRTARQYGFVFFTKGKPYYSNVQKRKVIVTVCKDTGNS